MPKLSGHVLVETLLQHGVDRFFEVPGESFLPVLDAFHGERERMLVVNRHEEGASFAAEGYGKASGRPAVCMATRGVGSSNLAIGIHTARQDSTPMIALVGQVPSRFRHREAFQELDLERVFGGIAKWAVELRHADRTEELTRRAFEEAVGGRPGPVVLSLPEDVLFETAEALGRPPVQRYEPEPSDEALEALADAVSRARFPLIVAGGGVLAARASAALVALAEASHIPVMTAYRRPDVFPNSHPYFLGAITFGQNAVIDAPLREADLVIGIGTRFSEMTTRQYRFPAEDATVFLFDRVPTAQGLPGRHVVQVPAGSAQALRGLQRVLSGRRSAPSPRVADLRAALTAHQTPPPPADGPFVDLAQVMLDIRQEVPPETAIVSDAGNFAAWLARYVPFERPHTHYGPTSGAMGYGLPAAIGVALARPQHPVIVLAGDGGFAMTMSELETAVRLGLPIVSIVFVNGVYGTILNHQNMRFAGREAGVRFGNPSFSEIARATGAAAFTVSRTEAFADALQAALRASGPALIEVAADPSRLRP